MKKVLIFCMLLIGCASVKSQSRYILKLSLVERSNSEGQTKRILTRIDTIQANSDTAAFSEANKRFSIYNTLMIAKYKPSKDSSAIVRGTFYTFKDATGNDVITRLPGKYLDSIMSSNFIRHHK